MNHSVKSVIRKVLAFTLFIVFVGCFSYLAVYKLSLLPNGYEIVSQEKEKVTIKSFNITGWEKDTIILSLSKNDLWKIEELNYAVKRQKESLWFLFTASSFSIFILILKLREGKKFWHAIWESRIVFATLFPLFIVVNSLSRIHDLIS
ncbi:hypothetical protein FQ087_05270 [Sporosarcina sp. ANT_H38]|uniref:hypothetical protein n=1 Tax=Sporosarcina sp. ANT_H38 TaxID=2597358 RepID=UPI0011F1274B|nr:hypothetical protein [Sporosarcina sp. ANT_H38]KAA0965697.1 hypothetical protein FQ087_05270 [Sporosarcina sp. ANT_H38]